MQQKTIVWSSFHAVFCSFLSTNNYKHKKNKIILMLVLIYFDSTLVKVDTAWDWLFFFSLFLFGSEQHTNMQLFFKCEGPSSLKPEASELGDSCWPSSYSCHGVPTHLEWFSSTILAWPRKLHSLWVCRDHDCGFVRYCSMQEHGSFYLLNISILLKDYHKY